MRHASYAPARSLIVPSNGPAHVLHEAGFFASHDGSTLFEQTWAPRRAPRARVLLIHGLYDHCDRYSDLAATLVDRDFAVHGYDLRGHGHSEGVRGDFQLDEHLADLAAFVSHVVRPSERWAPVVMVGRGIGSILGLLYTVAMGTRAPIAGLVSLALVTRAPRALSVVARVASVFRPETCAYEPQALADATSSADPLIWGGGLTRRAATEIARGWTRLKHQADALRVPLLVLEGGADPLVDPREVSSYYDRTASHDKMMRVYPGLTHDWLRKPQRDQIIRDVIAWLEARV
jgi:acylglycerol lipase